MEQEIWRHDPIGSKVELVERLLERGVAADGAPAAAPHDPARAITKNRQPVMVDLPAVESTLPSRRAR